MSKMFAAAVAVVALMTSACVAGGAPQQMPGDEESMNSADGGATSSRPVLVMLMAQVSGRAGRDVRVSFTGKDRGLDITALFVRALDVAGQPVAVLDLNSDGIAEASEGTVSLDAPQFVGETLSAAVVLRGAAASAQATQLVVSLIDKTSARSEDMNSVIAPQPTKTMGSTCDPKFLLDRCSEGLGCRGTPPACAEGLPPQIGKLGFYKNSGGPMILVEGTEPEDDLASIRFEFQNTAGKPISIDSDGDGTADLTSFTMDVPGLAVDGTFFLRMQAGDGLDQQVGKLVATPIDSAGHSGTAKTAAPTVVPVKSASQACDPRGFDTCATGFVCGPGIIGKANKCEAVKPLRANACASAPVLVATSTGASIIGRADGVSLWNTPAGCSSNDPQNRPEGVVTVRLTERANTLKLSTANAGTTFDTAMYVLQGCPDDSSKAFQCSGDAPGAKGLSMVELTDLPAGDYLVVIDSFDFVGGTFELTAQVQ